VPATAPTLARGELQQAAKRLAALSKLLTAATKKKQPTTVLRDDVQAELAHVLPLPPAARPVGNGQRDTTVQRVLEAVAAAREGGGLAFVPRVLQLLQRELDAAAAQRALLDAAARGLLELRPEGGMGRLSEAERRACPEGPQGTRLSWARLTGGES
jgi:hypothetical protein